MWRRPVHRGFRSFDVNYAAWTCRRPHCDNGGRIGWRPVASVLFVGTAVVEALAFEILAQPLLLAARVRAVGLGLAEPHAVFRRLLGMLRTLALLAVFAQVDDVAHGHKLRRRRPADAIA